MYGIQSLEHVLQNINKLNRSLEGIIAVRQPEAQTIGRQPAHTPYFQVGNEFSSVEALWSQFENVMAKDTHEESEAKADEAKQGHPGAP